MRSNIVIMLGLLFVSPFAYTSDELESRVKILEQRVSDLEKILKFTLPTNALSAEAKTNEEEITFSNRNEEELALDKTNEDGLTTAKSEEEEITLASRNEDEFALFKTNEEGLASAKTDEEEIALANRNEEELALARSNEDGLTIANTDEEKPIFAKPNKELSPSARTNEGGLALSEWTYTYKRDSMGDYYVINYALKNNYDKNIKLVYGSINFKDSLGTVVFGIAITSGLKIPAGETVKHGGPYLFNQFVNGQLIMKDMDKRDIVTEVIIRKLVFDDNTVLEM